VTDEDDVLFPVADLLYGAGKGIEPAGEEQNFVDAVP
jgi:hypothetical protein